MRRTENGRGGFILALASKRKAGYLMKYDLTKAEERKLRQIRTDSGRGIFKSSIKNTNLPLYVGRLSLRIKT